MVLINLPPASEAKNLFWEKFRVYRTQHDRDTSLRTSLMIRENNYLIRPTKSITSSITRGVLYLKLRLEKKVTFLNLRLSVVKLGFARGMNAHLIVHLGEANKIK